MYALVMFVQLWNVYFVILQYAGCFIANTSNSLLPYKTPGRQSYPDY